MHDNLQYCNLHLVFEGTVERGRTTYESTEIYEL